MDSIYSVLVVVLGILLRLGVPVAITVGLISFLRWLDNRWQQEADNPVTLKTLARNTRCWEARGCSEENKASCPAYAHPETPCWQLFRSKDGVLRQNCIGCQVFQTAPVPVTSGD